MRKWLLGLLVAALALGLAVPALAGGDPTGANVPADKLTAVGLNFVWIIVAGSLVFFMQAGFALVETGFTRAMTCPWAFSARSSCSSAGSASTPAPPWRALTCVWRWSR